MADNAAYAMNWLLKHGYTQPQAAAMVGHGMQESGLRTDATGDNGTAKGIFQWRGDRLAGLHSFAAATGSDPNNIDTQLGFMDHELNTTERRAGDALRAATNVRDATRAGMMFERPQGYTADNPEAGHGWANRFGEASRLAGVPVDASAAPAAAPAAMLRPSVLPGPPAALATAFLPAIPVDDEIARRQAVAAAQELEKRKALLGGGGVGQMFG
ncbi:MAG: phage tail tip lysozyme [Rhizomicrobium sp.]